MSDGVFIVRMRGAGGLHHIVCVDSRDEKRIIYDNEEKFPIRLSSETLRLCGHPEKHPNIAEVRQLINRKK